MTSKHRVFSHSNDINFNDYIKNKRGVEMIKNTKSKIGPKIIKYFNSYSDFINLAKVYYKYLTKGQIDIQVPTNILNTNTSFLVYDKINAHINSCKYCYNLDLKCDDIMFENIVDKINNIKQLINNTENLEEMIKMYEELCYNKKLLENYFKDKKMEIVYI